MEREIIVQFRIDEASGDDHLARRHHIEDYLHRALQAAKVGEGHGGDLAGDRMQIYVLVTDAKRASEIVLRTLKRHGDLDEAVVAIGQADDQADADVEVIWPPGYGPFSSG